MKSGCGRGPSRELSFVRKGPEGLSHSSGGRYAVDARQSPLVKTHNNQRATADAPIAARSLSDDCCANVKNVKNVKTQSQSAAE
jgi:hypothetical protein